MRIAVFGATFDPPHLGHIQVVRSLLENKLADQVWLVPVKAHPFTKTISPAHYRLAMVKLAIATLPAEHQAQVRIETYELDQPGVSYSINTLEYLKANYPAHIFSWVIGSDNLPTFPQWHRYQELLAEFEVWVYPRPGFPLTNLLTNMKPLTGLTEVAVASTQVREAVKNKLSISGLVAPAIEQYIHDQGLYTEV